MNINWKNIETKIIINNKNSDAKNILFLHGFGGNYNNKLSFYNFFNQYNYYCINMVGHGNSLIENKEQLDLLYFKEVALEFILKNNLKELIIMGHSMGGGISLLLFDDLKKHNIKFSYILEAPLNSSVMQNYSLIEKFIPNTIEDSKAIMNALFFDPIKVFGDQNMYNKFVEAEFKKMHNNSNLELLILKDRQLKWTQLIDDVIKRLDVKTLLILGDKDPLIPAEQTSQLFKNNVNIKTYVIKNSKHMPFLENKDICFAIVKNFIDSL